jgi:hypothetical protein
MKQSNEQVKLSVTCGHYHFRKGRQNCGKGYIVWSRNEPSDKYSPPLHEQLDHKEQAANN